MRVRTIIASIAAMAALGLGGSIAATSSPAGAGESPCAGRRVDVALGVAGVGTIQLADCARIRDLPDASARQVARDRATACPGEATITLWTHASPHGPVTRWNGHCG